MEENNIETASVPRGAKEVAGIANGSPGSPFIPGIGRVEIRQAPHNLGAEQELLGAILVNNEAMDRVSSFLEPQHFFDPLHQQIFDTLAKFIHAGKLATPLTLRTFFENAGPISQTLTVPQYLGTLAATATTIINAYWYGRTIFDLATRRALIIICEDTVNCAFDSPVESEPQAQIENALQRLAEVRDSAYPDATDLIEFAADATLESVGVPVIDGLLSSGSGAVLLGRWGAGKTFIEIRAGYSIAHGHPFMGRETRQGAVLFVPLEGHAGFIKRLLAANKHYGDPGKFIATLTATGTVGPLPGSDAFVGKIIAAAKTLEQAADCPVRLIVIDTLAKALGGADENQAATMAAVWIQSIRIIEATGATVLFSHHPTKSDPKQPRGTGDIMGGADEVLRIDHKEGARVRELHIVKSRDGEEGPAGTFTLQTVEVGTNADGPPITTCIVKPSDTACAPKKPKQLSPSSQAGKALTELEHLMASGKGRVSRGHDRIPDGVRLIEIDDWRAACRRKQLSADGEYEAEKKAFQRAQRDMSRNGLLGEFGSSVWLTGHANTALVERPK